MNLLARRVLFYVGLLALVTLMCQDVVRSVLVDVLGDSRGTSLYKFIRTNVEAPISAIFIAGYLDLVLGGRRAQRGQAVP
jgi:hypothetical protein